ncbi:cobaltochelatase subunit CobN [Methanimicrococcus sp. OttesenSCG-928-J09]|nr:cobaltochelatase subunit CobN [Methanimicrococcus sp. OttesenSCG-928-J09]
MNITYIGFNASDSFAIEVLMEDYLGTEKDYLNSDVLNSANSQIFRVNYHYINGYETSYDNSELKAFTNPGTGDIQNQDIVIIDMLFVYDNQNLVSNLKTAKEANPNLKLIQIRSDEIDSDGIFDSLEDDELINLITTDFYAYDLWNDTNSSIKLFRDCFVYKDDWSNSSNLFRNTFANYDVFYKSFVESQLAPRESDAAALSMAITCHLLKEYAPPEKIEEMNFEKTKILYIGYNPGSESSKYSGVVTFAAVKSILAGSVYGTFMEIDTVSFGTVPDSSSNVYPQLQDGDWYSPEILYNNMEEQGLRFEDYHVILFDGFFTEEILVMFSDVFSDASDAGADFLFHTQYYNTATGTSIDRIKTGLPEGSETLMSVSSFVMPSNSAVFNQTIQVVRNSLISKDIGTQFSYNFIYHPVYATLSFGGYLYHPVETIRKNSIEEYMIAHEQTESHNPGKPYIAIIGFKDYTKNMEDLSKLIEEQGYNTVVVIDNGFDFYANMDQYLNKTKFNSDISDIDNGRYITSIISYKNWALDYSNQENGVYNLEQLNVPVIKAVGSYNDPENSEIYDTGSGVLAQHFTWMGSSSNLEGMIDFIATTDAENQSKNLGWVADRAMAWAKLSEKDNIAKNIAIMYYNYPPGKEEIGANYLNVMRSLAGDGAKNYVADPSLSIDSIGRWTSYKGILRELRDENYNVSFDYLPVVTIGSGGQHVFDYTVSDEDLIMNEVNLVNLIYTQGINVGSYAPGVLDTMVQERIDYINDENPRHTADNWWGAELIPVSDYLKWIDHEINVNETMNKSLWLDATEVWGTPQAFGAIDDDTYWGGMIWTDTQNQLKGGKDRNYIVVPMIKFGDVRIMPEPNRALASDKALSSTDYHGDLPPTHQYIATYFWLNRGTGDSTGGGTTGFVNGDGKWKADALIHFGTHGTQEWLPGTPLGLSRTDDWGPVLLPTLPNIYPYIVANVGEGLTAEYRGNALIISHMTPPMVKTQLYDKLIEMETAIRGYQKNVAAGSEVDELLTAYRSIIVQYVFEFGWNDAFTDVFESYKRQMVADDDAYPNIKKTSDVTDKILQDYLISNKDGVFDNFLNNHLHNFVEGIRETSLSYGTHVYGSFEDKQVIPMVWNMWSRQGLDDILLETYFDDVPEGSGIPTAQTADISFNNGEATVVIKATDSGKYKYSEDDILKFVTLVVNHGEGITATDIRDYLDQVFTEDVGDTAYQNKIIIFLLGPGYLITDGIDYSGTKNNTAAKINATLSTTTDPEIKALVDEMSDQLYDFYSYSNKPPAKKDMTLKIATTIHETRGYMKNHDGVYSYEAVEYGLGKAFGTGTSRPWYNEDMVHYLRGNDRIDYAQKILECGDSEMNSLKNALSAGYISPSSGNDPVLNPYVLPTGRNFYGIDPSTYPTPAAWKVGQAMGEQMLVHYYETHGKWPETISMMRFGVDFIQDEGTLEACLFYLIGCEPVWGSGGKLTGTNIVTTDNDKYDDMFHIVVGKDKDGNEIKEYRPRVDVVYNSAGMRDGFGSILVKIDKAIKEVAALKDGDHPEVSNSIRKNALELVELLGGSESDAELWDLATSRIFAQAVGTYEIGTGNLVSASGNLDPDDQDSIKAIADLYLEKMSYLYSQSKWGADGEDISKLLKALLGRTDASVFASAGNLYDSLDNDDVYQYFGIMNMASSMYDKDGNYIEDKSQWKTPQMYIADTSNVDAYKDGKKIVYTAGEYIQKDLAARYLNPEWIQGQKEAGYSGAALMAEFIENLYGWSIATNGEIISESTWDRIFETYTSDEITKWLEHTSPYALQSINARMVEAMRTGAWSPDLEGLTDEEIKAVLDKQQSQMDQLVENYVKSVIESGVACCHHTCGNPTFDSFVQGMLQTISPDVLNDEEKQTYLEIVKKATEQPKSSPKESTSSGSGVGMASVVELNTDPNAGDGEEGEDAQTAQNPGVGMDGDVSGTPVNEVNGFEMTVTKAVNSVRDFIQNPTFSTSSIIAIAFVVIIVGAIFYGSRRKNL